MLMAGRMEVIVDREADSFELLTVPFLFFSYLLSKRCLFITRVLANQGVCFHT